MRRPLRPPTHASVPFATLAKLATELEGVAEDGILEMDALLDLASELGVGVEKLLAAVPQTELKLKTGEPVRFEVCVGGCQDWGALACAEHLANEWERRSDDGEKLFDIVPRECLDKCQSAATVVLVTPDGRAVIAAADATKLDEALAAL